MKGFHFAETTKHADNCSSNVNQEQNSSISNQYHRLSPEETLYLPEILHIILGFLEPKDLLSAAQFVLF